MNPPPVTEQVLDTWKSIFPGATVIELRGPQIWPTPMQDEEEEEEESKNGSPTLVTPPALIDGLQTIVEIKDSLPDVTAGVVPNHLIKKHTTLAQIKAFTMPIKTLLKNKEPTGSKKERALKKAAAKKAYEEYLGFYQMMKVSTTPEEVDIAFKAFWDRQGVLMVKNSEMFAVKHKIRE